MRNVLLAISVLVCTTLAVQSQERVELQSGTVLEVRTLSTSLPYPTSVTVDPEGYVWSTDKNSGTVWRMHPGGWSTIVGTISLGASESDPEIRGGLFDVEVGLTDQDGNPIVVVSYTTPDDHLVVARYEFDGEKMQNPVVILDVSNVPYTNGHSMMTLADGTILVSVGSYDTSEPADLNTLNGKLIRINTDGSAPTDNPMYNEARPANAVENFVYSLGHRQLAGLTQLPADHASLANVVYAVEPGAYSYDEINRIEAGHNYGLRHTSGYCTVPLDGRFDCPKATFHHAPSSVAFYGSDAIPEWKNTLLIGTLRQHGLIVAKLNDNGDVANIDPTMPSDDVMVLNDDQIVQFVSALGFLRIRSVAVDAEGRIYMAMNSSFEGELFGRIAVIENPAIHAPTSVNEAGMTNVGFKYGPNPVMDVVNVSLTTESAMPWTVRVVDLMGHTVVSREHAASVQSTSLPLSGIPTGSYLLVVTTPAGTSTAPLIH